MALPLRSLSVLLSSCLAGFASAQYSQTWSAYRDLRRYGNEAAYSMVKAPDGGYFVCSSDRSDAILRKIDTSGAVTWARAIPGITAATLLSNGTGVIAVGNVQGSGPACIFAEKFDTSGHALWSTRCAKAIDVSRGDAILDPSGNVVVGTTAGVLSRYDDGILAKLNGATGAVMFQDSYGTATTFDRIQHVRTDSAGNVFVVASTQDAQSANPPTTQFMKYSPTGALLWTKNFAATLGETVSIDGSGNAYLTTSDTTGPTSAIVKLDPNGNILWTKSLGSGAGIANSMFGSNGNMVLAWTDATPKIHVAQVTPGGTITNAGSTSGYIFSSPNDLLLDGSGNVYVGGSFQPQKTVGTATLFKFNLSSGFVWERTETGSFGVNNLGFNPTAVLMDGANLICASTVSNVAPTLLDTRVFAYDAAGNKLWSEDYDPQMTSETAAAAVTDVGGNTYVVDYDPSAKLTRFDQYGNYVWTHTLSTLQPDGNALAPQISINRDVVIAERYLNTPSGETGALYFYDPLGNILWKYSLTSTTDILRDYQVAKDGTIYLAFEHFVNNIGNLRLVHLSTAGAVLWTVNDTAVPQQRVFHIDVDSNGSALVTYGAEFANLSVAKFNSSGVAQWHQQIVGNQFGTTGTTRLDNANNLLLLINLPGPVEKVVKVDPNGNVLWNATVNITSSNNENTPLVVDKFGNSFVAGWNNNIVRLQKFTSAGALAWTVDYTMTLVPSVFPKLLPDQAGGVFALMNAESANGLDYCLLKVAANGTFPWPVSGGIFVNHTIRYDGRNLDDTAAALTADSLGNLFVSGSSFGPGGTQDVNVVKYSPGP